jgi:hypothetical protein
MACMACLSYHHMAYKHQRVYWVQLYIHACMLLIPANRIFRATIILPPELPHLFWRPHTNKQKSWKGPRRKSVCVREKIIDKVIPVPQLFQQQQQLMHAPPTTHLRPMPAVLGELCRCPCTHAGSLFVSNRSEAAKVRLSVVTSKFFSLNHFFMSHHQHLTPYFSSSAAVFPKYSTYTPLPP